MFAIFNRDFEHFCHTMQPYFYTFEVCHCIQVNRILPFTKIPLHFAHKHEMTKNKQKILQRTQPSSITLVKSAIMIYYYSQSKYKSTQEVIHSSVRFFATFKIIFSLFSLRCLFVFVAVVKEVLMAVATTAK